MELGSGSHSRSQVSVAIHGSIVLVILECHRLAGRNRLAVSNRRGTVLLVTTLPQTVDPRVPPLSSIVLDRRRGQKVGPCFGKTTSGTWWRQARIGRLSEHSCVRPSVSRVIAGDRTCVLWVE